MKRKRLPVFLFMLAFALCLLPASSFAREDSSECPPHDWVAVDGSAPSCTSEGYQFIICEKCRERREEVIPRLPHSYGELIVTREANCSAPGIGYRTCTMCGATIQEEIPVLPHVFSDWWTDTAPTCTSPGREMRRCQVCGYYQTNYLPAAGHSYGYWYTLEEATCTASGTRMHTCYVCGYSEYDTIPVTDHTYGEWTVIQEATGHSTGLRAHTCSTCGYQETESFYPEGTLRRGERGDNVARLQEALNQAGYNCGAADGIFGQMTQNAVAAFEQDNGMEADGIAWPDVQSLLEAKNKLGGSSAPAADGYRLGLSVTQLSPADDGHHYVSQWPYRTTEQIRWEAVVTNEGIYPLDVSQTRIFENPDSEDFYDLTLFEGENILHLEPGASQAYPISAMLHLDNSIPGSASEILDGVFEIRIDAVGLKSGTAEVVCTSDPVPFTYLVLGKGFSYTGNPDDFWSQDEDGSEAGPDETGGSSETGGAEDEILPAPIPTGPIEDYEADIAPGSVPNYEEIFQSFHDWGDMGRYIKIPGLKSVVRIAGFFRQLLGQ